MALINIVGDGIDFYFQHDALVIGFCKLNWFVIADLFEAFFASYENSEASDIVMLNSSAYERAKLPA